MYPKQLDLEIEGIINLRKCHVIWKCLYLYKTHFLIKYNVQDGSGAVSKHEHSSITLPDCAQPHQSLEVVEAMEGKT